MQESPVRRGRVIPTLALSLILCASTGPASVASPSAGLGLRHAVTHTDANDVGGPLDLRSLRLVHRGPRFDRLTFSTWGPVTDADLSPSHRGDFAIGIDLNDASPIRYEYWIYVHVLNGELRGLVVRHGSARRLTTPVGREGPGRFWVDVPLRALGRPASYRFALYSYFPAKPCARLHAPCVDKMPNRLPLILQDLSKPTVTWRPSPANSAALRSDLTYPARFTVRDDAHGSGVKRWELERQTLRTTFWKVVGRGAKATPTVSVPGVEGQAYRLRVVAVDRAGNATVSGPKTIVFPFDDQNAAVTFAGTWTHPASVTSFLGTTSASNTLADTATFTFTGGSSVCVLGMPVAVGATASALVDEHPAADASETAATPNREAVECYPVSGGHIPHQVVLTVAGGPDAFVLDGFEVVP
jgi:hypothetical protein